MSDHTQLTLDFTDETSEFMRLVTEIVRINGLQESAHAIGMTDSALSHALAGRKRRVIPLHVLPRLSKLQGGEQLLRFVARRLGLELIAHVPASVEENYIALSQVLREQLGGQIRKPLLRAQRQRVAANRGVTLRLVKGAE